MNAVSLNRRAMLGGGAMGLTALVALPAGASAGPQSRCRAYDHVQHIEQIDREFVSPDIDQAGHDAWLARWVRAYEELEHVPASSGRGLAAKLRQGIDGNGSETGDRIIAAALAQLEGW